MVIAEAKTLSGAVHEIAEKVGTEGLDIILTVFVAVSVLVAIVIVIPKFRKFISKLAGQ